MSQFETTIFRGTDEQATRFYKIMKANGLTPKEDFVLRRHLDLDIPDSMQHFYFSLEDSEFRFIQSKLLMNLPGGAKQELISAED